MEKKDITLFLFSFVLLVVVTSCITDKNIKKEVKTLPEVEICGNSTCPLTTVQNSSTTTINLEDVKVEVYHFHKTHQCYSCITVGKLAEKTVNTYFKDKLDSGRIVFAHINIDLPENRELVKKYGATGSSLWIGTYSDGKFEKEQNVKVWYKINDEEDYLTYLKGVLDKKFR